MKKGKYNGEGICSYPDGTKYKDGYRSGYGFYYSGGNYYMGEWKNDKKEGVGTYYYADGTYFCAL